jgi:hypothetical protein
VIYKHKAYKAIAATRDGVRCAKALWVLCKRSPEDDPG